MVGIINLIKNRGLDRMIWTMSQFFVGQIDRQQRTFTEEDVKRFMALTRDFNPVYNKPNDNQKGILKEPIIPGLLTEVLVKEVVSNKSPGKAVLILQKELRYRKPVYIGDTITAEIETIDIEYERCWITQRVCCFNQRGIVVIQGQVVVLVIEE